MFKDYTEVIYKGGYPNPIRITFKNAHIILTGEGGNRHIVVGDKDGKMNIWVDTHINDGKHYAFLGDVFIEGTPSSPLVNRVWKVITETVDRDNGLLKWTEENLNSFFNRLYFFANIGFYF